MSANRRLAIQRFWLLVGRSNRGWELGQGAGKLRNRANGKPGTWGIDAG